MKEGRVGRPALLTFGGAQPFGRRLSRKRTLGFRGETGGRKAAFESAMVYEELTTIPEAAALRERAARCRVMAKEYHPSVGAPLIELATSLEAQDGWS